MQPIFIATREGPSEVTPLLVVGDFAVVEGERRPPVSMRYGITWIPSGIAIGSSMTSKQAKDAAAFFGGTVRGRDLFNRYIDFVASRSGLGLSKRTVSERPVVDASSIQEMYDEKNRLHPKGSEQPYREPTVTSIEYEVESWLPGSRKVVRIDDGSTAMFLAVGYEAKYPESEMGNFIRVTRIDPLSKRTVVWWAMWDQDGWRTVLKDPSLPFDPDAIR